MLRITMRVRSDRINAAVRAYKAKHGGLSAEFRESLQQWYNTNGGRAIARELEELLALKEVGDGPFLGTSG